MLSDFIQNIKLIEEQWLKKIRKYVASLFIGAGLPSHDELHHLRVWSFAKQLLEYYEKQSGKGYSYDFIEALFFACLFHDTGLVHSIQEEHGEKSVEFAWKYLSDQSEYKNSFHNEAMRAIHCHDDKTYFNVIHRQVPGIYEFLTIADDLDAFGALGLMRYFEIYIHRGIRPQNIADRIKKNLKSRFDFLATFITIDKTLQQRHTQRYMLSLSLLNRLTKNDLEMIFSWINQGEFLPDQYIMPQDVVIYELINTAKKEGDIYH